MSSRKSAIERAFSQKKIVVRPQGKTNSVVYTYLKVAGQQIQAHAPICTLYDQLVIRAEE
jgi:hypothetical protein